MKIVKARIYLDDNAGDRISIITDMPDPCGETDPLTLVFYTRQTHGVEYLKENFPDVPYEIHGHHFYALLKP